MIQVWPSVLRGGMPIEIVKERFGKLLILVVINFVLERKVWFLVLKR
jgi:hypothetical protein